MKHLKERFHLPVLGLGLCAALVACGISSDDVFTASEKGNVSRVKALLKAHPELVNATDSKADATPLIWAAMAGKASVVSVLIQKGANLNATFNHGDTALHVTAEYSKSVETVRLLISTGANVKAKNDTGNTPLHVVTGGIRAVSWGLHPKGEAALSDSRAIADLLIAAGADVNAPNGGGGTPLHHAVASANKAVVELLISKGANVNTTTVLTGHTPLHTSCLVGGEHHVIARESQLAECEETDILPVVELLLAAGADINRRDAEGKTALGIAVKKKKNAVAQLLREHGAKE